MQSKKKDASKNLNTENKSVGSHNIYDWKLLFCLNRSLIPIDVLKFKFWNVA